MMPFLFFGQQSDTTFVETSDKSKDSLSIQTDEVVSELYQKTRKPQRINETQAPDLNLSRKTKAKNPKVATWLSVALPGAGQIYNGHWYKVPVIYGGAATLVYFYRINAKERDIFKTEYIRRLTNDSINPPNPEYERYSDENIRYIRDYYQRNIELVWIISGVLYVLNIIDACVFAHLSTFDVSDNLSIRVQPFATPMESYMGPGLPMNAGLKLSFTLK